MYTLGLVHIKFKADGISMLIPQIESHSWPTSVQGESMRTQLESIVKTSLQPKLVRLTKLSSMAYRPLCDGLHTTERVMTLLTYMHAWQKVGTRSPAKSILLPHPLNRNIPFKYPGGRR